MKTMHGQVGPFVAAVHGPGVGGQVTARTTYDVTGTAILNGICTYKSFLVVTTNMYSRL